MQAILKLRPAFSDDQVSALAMLFDEQLATKTDLEALALKLRLETERFKLELQRDLRGIETRLVTWLLGTGLAIAGGVIASIRPLK